MSTMNAEKSTLLPQKTPDIESSDNQAPIAKDNDSHAIMSDIKTIRKRTDSADPSTTKRKIRKRQRGEKVGCIKVGTYSATFEQKDLDESVTLQLLVNSNIELNPEV
ncbi:hypothetical protein E4T48_00360 [Aureobasidium sp. EXF-10727]|nr:hypothetical protein E4T48_00360 [Aureobasidium sp. EXF-10727]KAI4729784.1 hypothetical protein E4T49_02413 [Aureobasidium sp. EXF-10728]